MGEWSEEECRRALSGLRGTSPEKLDWIGRLVEALRKRGNLHEAHLWSLSHRAHTCQSKQQFQKAEELFDQVLKGRQELEDNHVDKLRSKHDLAFVLLQGTGNYAQARRMLGEILPLMTEVLSENHPDTLWCKHHLALSHQYEGDYREAERLHLEVLAVRVEMLGADHPDTLETKTDLGNLSKDDSKWEEAVRYHLEVWTSRDRQLGPLNYSTVVSLQNLAISLYELGAENEDTLVAENEGLTRLLLELGVEDELVAEKEEDSLYDRRGRRIKEDALQKLQRARECMEDLQGSDGRAAIMIGYNLALLQVRAGEDAEALFREIIDKMERVFTGTHPHTWLCWSKFACHMKMKARRSQTNLAEAERRAAAEEAEYYFKRARDAMQEGGLTDGNPMLQDCRAMLAKFYYEQGELQQAEDMLRDVVHHMEKDPGIKHVETCRCVQDYINILEQHAEKKRLEGMMQEQELKRQERKRWMLKLGEEEESMEGTTPTETTGDHDNIEDLLLNPEGHQAAMAARVLETAEPQQEDQGEQGLDVCETVRDGTRTGTDSEIF